MNRQKVAVVAVHGVGQHAAGASAQAVADLLAGLRSYTPADIDVKSPYSAFSVNDLDVPLPDAKLFTPFPPEEKPKDSLWTSLSNMFEERRGIFARAYTLSAWFLPSGGELRKTLAGADVAGEFMKVQIDEYKGEPSTSVYSTCRLEGHRTGKKGEPDVDVHVYEVHWSDLSSPDNTFIRFFMAFYQLLLHLTSLGRIAVDQVALEHMRKWDWFLYQRLYSYASRTLTLLVFNLLVVLPVVAFAPLVLLLPSGAAPQVVALTIVFVAALGGLLYCSQNWLSPFGARHWWPIALVGALLCTAAARFALQIWYRSTPLLLMIEWWLLAMLVLGVFIFPAYDEVRNGELQAGWACVLVTAVCFFAYLRWHMSAEGLPLSLKIASYMMLQYLLLALRFAWIAFTILAIAAFCMEVVCRLRLRGEEKKAKLARARAAARTGRFTLALSSILLMLVSIFLWCGIYHAFAKKVALFSGVKPQEAHVGIFTLTPDETDIVLCRLEHPKGQAAITSPPADSTAGDCHAAAVQCKSPARHGKDSCTPYCLYDGGEWKSIPSSRDDPNRFIEGMLLQSAHPGLPFVIGISTAALLLFALIVLPSVWRELKPPLQGTNGQSKLLGAWLSSGLSSLRAIIALFWAASFAVPAVYFCVATAGFSRTSHSDWSGFAKYLYLFPGMDLTKSILDTEGALFAGSATLLVGLLLKYGSVVLDTILDVDNYLRTSPATSTPRARIAERYLALLNYLHQYRTPADGLGYDRIVIVAHSLGSLITADLLRFLQQDEIPKLTKYAFPDRKGLPLYFFSMGNPLRQLLNRFFPTLYGWVRDYPDGSGITPAQLNPGQLDASDTPKGEELGVELWRNSYRSGDYVGRSLWLSNWYTRTKDGGDSAKFPKAPRATSFTVAPGAIECCVGLGAHTHYWDRTAPDIAAELDELIVM
jgi:hypothetical protein